MIIINDRNYYTIEELQQYAEAVATVAKYMYYNEYVEKLEIEYDELETRFSALEYEDKLLKEKNRRLRQANAYLTNKHKPKVSVLNENDAERYRKQCIKLKEEKNNLERHIVVLENRLKFYENKQIVRCI